MPWESSPPVLCVANVTYAARARGQLREARLEALT